MRSLGDVKWNQMGNTAKLKALPHTKHKKHAQLRS